uniref:EGF-like domain-containing protein n=1 Tax=Plectus sambesii TaxID=2011161 RepID=A0A914WLG5_9BILA
MPSSSAAPRFVPSSAPPIGQVFALRTPAHMSAVRPAWRTPSTEACLCLAWAGRSPTSGARRLVDRESSGQRRKLTGCDGYAPPEARRPDRQSDERMDAAAPSVRHPSMVLDPLRGRTLPNPARMSRRLRRRRRLSCRPPTSAQQRIREAPPLGCPSTTPAASAYSSFDMLSPSTSSATAPCLCVGHCDMQRSDTVDGSRTCTNSDAASSSSSPSSSDYSRTPSLERFCDYARSSLPSVIILLLRSLGLLLDVISTSTGNLWCIRLLTLAFLPAFVDGCSTRPSPKPRPARPYWHPDTNLPRLNCTEDYRDLYCLNNGSCYMQLDISNIAKPYCICDHGYRGRRCESIHDDGVFSPAMQAKRIETAALSALVTLLVVATCIASLALYLYRRRAKYPVEYVDAASEIGTLDYPFNFRARNDAVAFRSRRMESMPSGSGGTSGSRPSSVQQTSFDHYRQEVVVTASQSERSSQGQPQGQPHLHRPPATPSIVELGPSSV